MPKCAKIFSVMKLFDVTHTFVIFNFFKPNNKMIKNFVFLKIQQNYLLFFNDDILFYVKI